MPTSWEQEHGESFSESCRRQTDLFLSVYEQAFGVPLDEHDAAKVLAVITERLDPAQEHRVGETLAEHDAFWRQVDPDA